MSRAAKLTLFGTSMFAVGTIVFVHFQQQAEKAVRESRL
jgi:protein PET117